MLLLLEAQWFESPKHLNYFDLFLRVYFGRGLYWLFSWANLIPRCSYNCYTQPFSEYMFHYRFYATRPNTHLLLFVLCFKIFIKSKPTIFIFFSYLILLFARTNFKKETKHGHYFVQGTNQADLAYNACKENLQLCTATLTWKRIHTKGYSCRRIQTIQKLFNYGKCLNRIK